MKKLMLIAAVAFATVAAQAAVVDWASNRNGAKEFAGLSVYLVDGGDYSAVIAALTAGGADVATTFNNYVVDSATVAANGSSSGQAVIDSNSIALFVFKDGIADGNTYLTSGVVDVSEFTYGGTDQSPGKYYFTPATFATEGSIGQAVPEPTSGLLLLLGMAGLALRRKVA